jgi:hypothetical protein
VTTFFYIDKCNAIAIIQVPSNKERNNMDRITDESLRRRTVSMRLPQWVIDWLRDWQAHGQGIGDVVEHALVAHYKISQIKVPEIKRSLRR